jgi:hypothetical protein
MVGGSLLLGSIRSMMGGSHQGFGDSAGLGGGVEDRRPWSDQSGGELARDAGINDIGTSGVAPTVRARDCSIPRRMTIAHRMTTRRRTITATILDSDDFGGDGDSDYA